MKLRLISIVSLIAAGLLAVLLTVSNMMQTQQQYSSYLTKARANAENEIPYMAWQHYRSALGVKAEDETVYQEYLQQAELLGESFYSEAVEAYIAYFPESSAAYEALCEYYYEIGNYKMLLETALEANQKGIATETVRDRYFECRYMLKIIKSGLDGAQSFLGSYARVEAGGKYGYIKTNGSYLLAPVYEGAGPFLNSSTAVNDGTEWYMMNTGGYKVARASEPVDSLSVLSGGKIRVEKDGKYGYMTSAMQVPQELLYDYASVYKNGVAAVKQGDKWALLDAEGSQITEFVFEDILLDEFETCINGGVIFAKYKGSYYMVDAEGSKISEQGYENARPFVSDEPAAVCVDGKWGFADTAGNLVIEPQYADAKSFCVGLAPVCVDGKWGYIDSNGVMRIANVYDDCLSFSANGITAVKYDQMWEYVQLFAYYYK